MISNKGTQISKILVTRNSLHAARAANCSMKGNHKIIMNMMDNAVPILCAYSL